MARGAAFAIARHSLRGGSSAIVGEAQVASSAKMAKNDRDMPGPSPMTPEMTLYRRKRRATIMFEINRSSVLAQVFPGVTTMDSKPARAPSTKRLEPLRHVDAGVLNIAYYEDGPSDGPVVMLTHGFPYDI